MFEIMVTSSILIIALVLLRYLLRNKISRRLQYALWLLVALRLLAPVTVFQNPFNILNVLQASADGEKYAEQSAGGIGNVVYTGEPADGKAKYGSGDGSLTAEDALPAQGKDILGENQRESEHQGEADVQETSGTGTDIMSLKEMGYLLEGGSWLNGFLHKGYLRYAWYLGMGVLGIWMIGCNLLFRRRIFKSRKVLGKEGGLTVYIAEGIGSPCLLGILHPAIYLTREAACNPRHREHTVLHELTHYQHKDNIWTFIRSLCLIIYWFDPLVWLAVYLSAGDCEMACDEGVAHRIGEVRSREYGRTLIEMAAVSGKKPGMLRCATGFSARKKELKERISRIAGGRKRTGILLTTLVIACGTALAACTFGGAGEEIPMGRYVEEVIELPEGNHNYVGLVQEGDSLRLVHREGEDLLSVDGGKSFSGSGEEVPPALQRGFNVEMAAAPDGSRLIYGFPETGGSNYYILITGDGREIALENPLGGSDTIFTPFYGAGYYYAYFLDMSTHSVYRIDPATGEMDFLLETKSEICYMAADEKLLYIVLDNSLILYDLEERQQVSRQDEILAAFLAGGEGYCYPGYTTLLYPYGNGCYLLSNKGLYWHELYGENVVRIIDGKQCGIGLSGRNFTGMTLLEGEGEPEFLIAYTDGTLARYTFDATIPSAPEALRIYSVYEDGNILKAVNAFRNAFPDIPIIYEVGMDSFYGATSNDALKNLATEIGAGNGPDILVMDDIPIDSYREKGVLMDLSFLREGMTDEEYFTAMADAFRWKGRQYVMPLTFSIPVLAGKAGSIKGVETLEQLADLLEDERAKGTQGPIFSSWDAESTLRLLSQSSMGAWQTDGTLNLENVRDFLIQAKRIYDAVMEDPATEVVPHTANHSYWNGEYPLERIFDCEGLANMMHWAVNYYPGQPYHAGFLSGAGDDFIRFAGGQEYLGDTCVLMPGQQYGTGLASALLAVNRTTGREEECRKFLEYVFSEEFQKESGLNGTPLNRAAYEARKVTEKENRIYWYSMTEFYDYGWPREEDFNNLDSMLDQLTGINYCDHQIYETMVELGKKALTGEQTIEEAVEAIESKVKIYLAE